MRIRPFLLLLPFALLACAHAGKPSAPGGADDGPVAKTEPPARAPPESREPTARERYDLQVGKLCGQVRSKYHLRRIYRSQAESYERMAAALFGIALDIEADVTGRMEARDEDPQAEPLSKAERAAIEDKLRWMRARIKVQALKILDQAERVFPQQRQAVKPHVTPASAVPVGQLQRACRESFDAGLALANASDALLLEVSAVMRKVLRDYDLERYGPGEPVSL